MLFCISCILILIFIWPLFLYWGIMGSGKIVAAQQDILSPENINSKWAPSGIRSVVIFIKVSGYDCLIYHHWPDLTLVREDEWDYDAHKVIWGGHIFYLRLEVSSTRESTLRLTGWTLSNRLLLADIAIHKTIVSLCHIIFNRPAAAFLWKGLWFIYWTW